MHFPTSTRCSKRALVCHALQTPACVRARDTPAARRPAYVGGYLAGAQTPAWGTGNSGQKLFHPAVGVHFLTVCDEHSLGSLGWARLLGEAQAEAAGAGGHLGAEEVDFAAASACARKRPRSHGGVRTTCSDRPLRRA